MPLSIEKLQDLITDKGFVPKTYYVMDGSCFYIELFCIKTAELFFLYIPSKYNFEIKGRDKDVFKIKYVDEAGLENPNTEEGEDNYKNNHIQLSPDKEKFEDHLEDAYKHGISIKDISTNDTSMLRTIYKQIKRLKYSVENLKYKLGILYKNYIISIRRDNTINCILVKNYPREDVKRLVVIADLETFYSKSEKLGEDIRTVKNSVYSLLNKNQTINTQVLIKMIENKKEIVSIPEKTETKHIDYMDSIRKTEEMLNIMNEAETKLLKEMSELNEDNSGSLNADISKVHSRSRIEKELAKISSIKEEIAKSSIELRSKCDNSILSVDCILFDNNVIWERMVKNFALLKEYIN